MRQKSLDFSTAPESGFEFSRRRSLQSDLIDGFTIAGVVLNAASLAVAIWALKNQIDQNQPTQKAARIVRVRRRPGGPIRTLPDEDIESIVKSLEEMTRPPTQQS